MIYYSLTQLTKPTGLQHVLDDFPNKAHEAVTALDYSFGLPGLTRCSHSILLYILANQYSSYNPKIVEVGAFKGHTTCLLSRACPTGHIYAIEPIYPDVIKSNLEVHDSYGFDNPYSNIQIIPMMSMDAIKQFDDYSVNMIFIDGDHDKAALQDIAWYNKLRMNGLIVFHDWYPLFPYVIEATRLLGEKIGKPKFDVELTLDGGLAGYYRTDDRLV